MTWILLAIFTLLILGLALIFFQQKKIQSELFSGKNNETPFLLIQKHLENLTQHLNDRLKDSNQLLHQSQQNVSQRLDNAGKVVGELQGKLGKLEEANRQLLEVGKDIRSLQEILRAPKLRGSLGEFFLSDLLTQILPPEHFEMQFVFQNNEKVDAVVKIGGKLVPVDAKFPLENFQRLMVAQDEVEKKQWKKQFVTDVKKHIDAIAQKYIRPVENTYDFALMYVPAENIYYEVIIKDEIMEGDHRLANYAMKKRVIPVSPNTLYVYLHTIVLGLKGLQVEKAAQQILAELTRLTGDLGKIQESFRKVGLHLHNAQGSFEDAQGRLGKFGDRMERLHGQPQGALETADVGAQFIAPPSDEKLGAMNRAPTE